MKLVMSKLFPAEIPSINVHTHAHAYTHTHIPHTEVEKELRGPYVDIAYKYIEMYIYSSQLAVLQV